MSRTARTLTALLSAIVPVLAGQASAQGSAAEQAILLAADAGVAAKHGSAVAVSGDTLVAGAPSDSVGVVSGAGRARIFVRRGASWTEEQVLWAEPVFNARFGASVAVEGDVAIVGAPSNSAPVSSQGAAWVYERTPAGWEERAKLQGPALINGHFGTAVALSGDSAIVGAPNASAHGSVFVRDGGGAWNLQQQLMVSGDATYGGQAVDIDGDTAALGAPGGVPSAELGLAYVFARSGTEWTQQAQLVPADNAPYDRFGASIAVSADTVAVGAPGDDHAGGAEAGSVIIFSRASGTWHQQAKLVAQDPDSGDAFGTSLALEGDTLVVGASGDDHASGSVRVFARSGGTWTQVLKIKASDWALGDLFGAATALSGSTLVSGAPSRDVAGDADAGAAYVYVLGEGPWTDLGSGLAGAFGIPALTGSGEAVAGSPASLELANAAPLAPALLFVALGSTPAPFKGGTLLPVPAVLTLGLATDALGAASLPFAWPAGLPSGLGIWFQVAIADAAAPLGVALSNGLKVLQP